MAPKGRREKFRTKPRRRGAAKARTLLRQCPGSCWKSQRPVRTRETGRGSRGSICSSWLTEYYPFCDRLKKRIVPFSGYKIKAETLMPSSRRRRTLLAYTRAPPAPAPSSAWACCRRQPKAKVRGAEGAGERGPRRRLRTGRRLSLRWGLRVTRLCPFLFYSPPRTGSFWRLLEALAFSRMLTVHTSVSFPAGISSQIRI